MRTCGKGKYEFSNRPLQKLNPLEMSSNEIDWCKQEKNVDSSGVASGYARYSVHTLGF